MDQLDLPQEQMEKLRQFTEVTNMDDWNVALGTLASLDWNLERAIEAHLMPENNAVNDQNEPEVMIVDQPPVQNNQASRPLTGRGARRRSRIEVDQEFDNQIGEDEPAPRYSLRNRVARGNNANGAGHAAAQEPLDLRTRVTRSTFAETQSVQSSSSSIASNSRNRDPESDDDAMVEDDDEEFYDADSAEIQADVRRTARRGNELALIPDDAQNVPEALQNFVRVFQSRYCTNTVTSAFMPNFNTQPLSDALSLAFERPNPTERRPMALYINHEDSIAKNIFVSQALCTDAVSSLLRHQYVFWPWDVTNEQNKEKLLTWTARLGLTETNLIINRTALDGPERFPLIVIVVKEKGRYSVVNMILGMDPIQEVIVKLMAGVEAYESIRTQEEQERREREERDEIRSSQQAEYEASVAADRARMEAQKREIELQRLEQERIRKEEEAEAQRRAKLASMLSSEPSETEKDIVNVKIRLPEGEMKIRRFRKNEQVQMLVTFLSSLGFHPTGFKYFNSDFPKKEINSSFDLSKTFADTKWPAREQVFVEEI